ncbi:MAG: DnaK suppressor protein [Gammaproteobacteria bacterium]|jgi:DnaK suppressor protein
MTDKDQSQKELSEMLDELTSRLSKIEEDIHHQESPVSADFAEQVTEDDEVLAALENETNATITNIRNALRRMEEGTYGSCAVCGVEIIEERMKALPYTDICFECSTK